MKDLLNQIRCSNELDKYLQMQVRQEPTNILPIETVEQTFNRMEIESEQYLSFDEVVDFFTVRGRPILLDQRLKGKQQSQPSQAQLQKQIQIEEHQKRQLSEKIYGKSFGAIKNINNQEFYVTIPNQTDDEPEKQKKGLRQKWLEKELTIKKREEDSAISYQFRAKSVPWYVTEPMLDKINREKEDNRLQIKDKIKQRILQDTKNPYSFENAKAKEWHEPKYHFEDFKFRARPVPNTSSNLLYQQILDEKQQTSMDNISRRKQELMDMSSYSDGVRNMLDRQDEREIMKSSSPYHKKGCQTSEGVSFEHFKANKMPDFERLHKNFAEQILERREIFTPTVPQGFDITQNSMKPIEYQVLNQQNQYEKKQDRINEIDFRLKSILKTPQNQAYATRKVEDEIDYKRKQKYNKIVKQNNEDLEFLRMKKSRQQLLPKGIQNTVLGTDRQKILNKELKESVQWKRQYNKNMENKYEKDKKKMFKNVRQRPLIMYSSTKNIEIISDGNSSEQIDSDNSYETGTDGSQYLLQ